MRAVGNGIGAGQSAGTVRIQFPDLSGKILIVEDENVDALAELLQGVKDVRGIPIEAEPVYVKPAKGMGNIVDIIGRIQTGDVRLVLSDHNLKLEGPDRQPIMGALFLKQLADVLGRQRPADTVFLAAYTGYADDLRRDYGAFVGDIPVIEKGGMQDVVTYCAATLAAVNRFRRLYGHLSAVPAHVQPQPPQQPRYTLAALVEEAAEDIRGNAGVTTPQGMQRIGTRIGTSYESEAGIRWTYLTGGERNGEKNNGSVVKVVSSLVTFCEHSSRVKPTYLLDMRPADRESEFDLPALTSERTGVRAPTALKVTLRVDQQFDGAQGYVDAIVRPMLARAFPEGKLHADRGQRGSYVLQLFIPDALAP